MFHFKLGKSGALDFDSLDSKPSIFDRFNKKGKSKGNNRGRNDASDDFDSGTFGRKYGKSKSVNTKSGKSKTASEITGLSWATIHRKAVRRLVIAGVVLVILIIVALYIRIEYEITSVTVMGNEHYTSDEIESFVFDKPYSYNSIFLTLMYNNKDVENIPFIERVDVDIVNPNKVRINVYEKSIAGYVEYLGHYMYFDKDGIVVESSNEIIEGVPYVTGLDYDHVVLHKALPVEDKAIFLLILDITHLLNKYEIMTDRIAFDSDGNITLYFGDARVSLGDDEFIDEKINEMHLLLPKLEGLSGVLHMENYDGDETNFSFDMDREEEEENIDENSEEDENADADDAENAKKSE